MSTETKVLDPKRKRKLDSREKFVKTLSVLASGGNDREVSDLVTQFNQGDLMLADSSIMATKNASDRSTVDMLLNTDEREVGVNSVAKAMLSKGQYMLVESITLLGVQAPVGGVGGAPATILERGSTAEREAFKKLKFGSLNAAGDQSALCLVANGELKVRVRNKDVVSGLSIHRFVQDNNHHTNNGTLQLDTPFFIRAQEAVEVILELPDAAKPNTLLRVLLNGTVTVAA